jgi:hypothetical protein
MGQKFGLHAGDRLQAQLLQVLLTVHESTVGFLPI